MEVKYMIDATKYQQDEHCCYGIYIFNFPFADTDSNTQQIFDTQYFSKGRHITLLKKTLQNIKNQNNRRDKVYCYITLLMSQAISWNIGDIATEEGYQLETILPFDFQYNRKRTYKDDTFNINRKSIGWTFVLSHSIHSLF